MSLRRRRGATIGAQTALEASGTYQDDPGDEEELPSPSLRNEKSTETILYIPLEIWGI